MSTEYDQTWPKVWPDSAEIRDTFKEYFRGEISVFESDENRLDYLQHTFMRQYPDIAARLHGLLTVRTNSNFLGLDGREVEKVRSEHTSLSTFHGLNRFLDIKENIAPVIGGVMEYIGESTLPTHAKLGNIAAMAAVVTTESQMFSDGNTRIARAIHDFALGGTSKIFSSEVFDFHRTYVPTNELEEAVMLQNVSYLIRNPLAPAFEANPARDITLEGRALYNDAQAFMNDIYRINPEVEDLPANVLPFLTKEQRQQKYQSWVDRSERLKALIDPELPERLKRAAFLALRQRKYGAAAWAATFAGHAPELPLSEDEAVKLHETDIKLLTMRVLMLAEGVGKGGGFVVHEEAGITPHLSIPHFIDWKPWGINRAS